MLVEGGTAAATVVAVSCVTDVVKKLPSFRTDATSAVDSENEKGAVLMFHEVCILLVFVLLIVEDGLRDIMLCRRRHSGEGERCAETSCSGAGDNDIRVKMGMVVDADEAKVNPCGLEWKHFVVGTRFHNGCECWLDRTT